MNIIICKICKIKTFFFLEINFYGIIKVIGVLNMEDKEKKEETFEETVNLEDEEVTESENITREINLDELYDGAVNNTVIIDPVTNNEILVANKKHNYTVVGIILAVCILLILYFITNKTDLGKEEQQVENKTTTTTVNTINNQTGTLTCNYSSKSDAETVSITYTADYENAKIITSNYSLNVISNSDSTTDTIESLKTQYETFYIKNAAIKGHTITFDKKSNSFTFNDLLVYSNAEFEDLSLFDGQTIMYVKATNSDTADTLKDTYENKGYTCSKTELKEQ